ncbi:MAG: alpha-glucosidase [Nocardiopsis sp. BM-2018]|nr:MAG: alpha-glucosidase [Nocardiopsis sp. BM-2018]
MPAPGQPVPWWTSATVYQIYPRSFRDANGDGVGDLAGILAELEHLEALGIDAVWLSPVYPSPMRDGGYDVADYQGVDPVFGTLAELDALIEALHERGMRLIIDVVLNHTSDQHPWFQASRRGTDDAKRDWYWWRPPRPGKRAGEPGAEPTNWRSYFGGPAWTLDPASGAYYLHLFDTSQPDLNWERPEVRQALYAMLRWWLARGVDGFRLDVINLVSKTLPLRDGDEIGADGLANGTPLFESGPRIHAFMQELHHEVLGSAGKVLLSVGEMLGVTPDQARDFTDTSRRELDMVFQFEHVTLDQARGDMFDVRPLPLTTLKRSLGRWQAALAERGWNSLYWCNHDQPRPVSRFGDDRPAWRERSAKTLATTLHLHRGTPFVYQGEELGLRNHPFDALAAFRDVMSLNYVRAGRARGLDDAELLRRLRAKSRDNGRTPMPWREGPNAGFGTGEPWSSVHADAESVHADAQRADPESVFHHYRRLAALRRALPVIALGDFRMLAPDHERLYAFERRLDDDTLLIVANWSAEELLLAEAGVTVPDRAERLLDTVRSAEGLGEPGVLRGWEARVFRYGAGNA